MGRVTIEKCCAPRFEPREFFDVPEPLDAIEKYIALQKRRVGGIDQRVLGTIEKRTAVFVLREKKVEFELRHIEPDNRPDWFLAISPHKKVPVPIAERCTQGQILKLTSIYFVMANSARL